MSKSKRPWIPLLILHLLSLIVFTLQIANGDYVEQFLESVEVCASATSGQGPFANLAKKKLFLDKFPNKTMVVKLTRWDQFWSSFLNFRCKFQVVPPKKHGVMVVIQAMHLRTRKPSSVACRDWVKFEQGDGFQTGQICGDLDDNDLTRNPDSLVGQRYFYDNKGPIDISFSTDGKDDDRADLPKPVSIKMVFTAYTECSPKGLATGELKQCSPLRSFSCIDSNLFCDNEVNCAFNDVEFGLDEKDCDGSARSGKSEIGGSYIDRPASLYVFAITCVFTLVVVIILVFVACCCLRRFAQRAHSRNQRPDLSREDLEFNLDMTLATGSISNPERPEKTKEDLPPSYDTLFPVPVSEKKK